MIGRDEALFERIDELVLARGGVDVILDPVGASYLEGNIEALRLNGRLVVIGLMGGRRAQLDLGRLLLKRLSVLGSTLRSRPLAEKSALAVKLRANVWPRFETGELKPVIADTFALKEAEEGAPTLGER